MFEAIPTTPAVDREFRFGFNHSRQLYTTLSLNFISKYLDYKGLHQK
jgi:hypothetical protein